MGAAVRRIGIFLDHLLSGLSRAQLAAVILAIIGVFGWIDYLTGFEIAYSFFYLFPILMATWYLNVKWGYSIALVSILVWLGSNAAAGEQYSSEGIRYWNAGIRLVFFISNSVILAYLKEALDKATHLSRHDPLTGVYNDREFYRLAELELARARRYQHPVCLAFFDLDNFKQVNDQLGHLAGDELLRTMAGKIKGCLRSSDLLARMGGDEFAILFPETDLVAAEAIANKLQNCIRAEFKDAGLPVTISLGVAACNNPATSLGGMLRRADELMYTVKSRGKDGFLIQPWDDPSGISPDTPGRFGIQ